MVTGALIGRTRELERLLVALGRASSGRGGTFLLSGEPGIGKTRLAEEVARCASAQGMQIVWGRTWEGGGAPPYWPWIQIARGLRKSGIEPPTELARLLPELGAAGPLLAPSADRFLLLDGMLRFILAASSAAPILLAFDDLHAADEATVQMLAFVAPNLRDARVLAIGTYRDVEARLAPALGDALADVARGGEVMRLTRLGRVEVAAMARERLTLDERELDNLFAITEGNPLFVTETVRMLADEGRREDGALPLSDSVRSTIRRHFARLSPLLRRDLDLAAVLGREFAASVLAAIAGESAPAIVARLSEAAAAGFLIERVPSRFAFAHGLFREVLVAELGSRAAELHERVGRTLEALHAGDPTARIEIARHWLEAGPEHAPHAYDATRRAAESAAASLAYQEAADLLERALLAYEQAWPGDARGRAEALLAAGEARIRAGEIQRGKEACEQAADVARALGDTDLLVRAALGHGSDFVAGARDRALATLLEYALAAVGSNAGTRARLLARLAAAQQPAWDPRGPIRIAREALELLDEIEDPATRLSVLHNASGAMVDFVDPRERERIDEDVVRLATQLGERAVHLRAAGRLYHDHAERGDLAGAAARLDAYERVAQAWPQPHVQLPLLLGRSCLALLHGRDDESARLVCEARAIASKTHDTWLGLAVNMHEIASLRIRGKVQELEARRDELRAPLDVFAHYPAGFDAMLAALRGDPASAAEALARLDRAHVRVCMDTMFATWVAEAAAVAKDADWGQLIEEVLVPLAGEWVSWSGVAFVVESPVARGRAFAAIARGDVAMAEAFFGAALDEVERTGAVAVVQRLAREAKSTERRQTSQAASARPTDAPVGFAREGEYWAVRGYGVTVRVRNSRGVEMLATLVAARGREHHVLDLASAGGSDEIIDAGDAGKALDDQARQEYRARLGELTREREEAETHHDPGRVERVRAEMDALAAELSQGVGLGGRVRRVGRAAERARVNVQRRMADAIRRIEEAHAPLGAHLRKSIRTGTFCSYAPERAGREESK